jgi:DNA polymerase-3 subunit gamma/tau
MSQAFYRKWRPRQWDQVAGQEHIIHTLQNAIRNERIGHAYLFAGPRGTGKTTTARLLAKAANCLAESPAERPCNQCAHCQAINEGRFLDLIEIDAASNTSVEDVRDLRDKINFSPTQGRYKVYIIDEVHMLSTAAFNALLKTLEEPPPHAIFILATTEVHKIPATVLSRCQRHEFRRIPLEQILAYLNQIVKEEELQVDQDALTMIARQATGSMRDAISLLDQLASTGEHVSLEMAQTVLGTATNQAVMDLVGAILKNKPADGLQCIHQALNAGSDPRQFARQVVDYLRSLLVIRMGNANLVDATGEQRKQMEKHASYFELDWLLQCIDQFNRAATDTRGGWQPGLLLELGLAESLQAKEKPTSPPAVEKIPDKGSPTKTATPSETPSVEQHKLAESKQSHTTMKEPQSKPPAPAQESGAKPASAAQPQPTTGQNAAAASGIGIQDLSKAWDRVKAQVKKTHPLLVGLLNSAKMVTIKDGALVLGFYGDVLKSKMENKENNEITRQAVKLVLGVDMPIISVMLSNKSNAAPTDLDVDNDGMVGTALNLGGQIVNKE